MLARALGTMGCVVVKGNCSLGDRCKEKLIERVFALLIADQIWDIILMLMRQGSIHEWPGHHLEGGKEQIVHQTFQGSCLCLLCLDRALLAAQHDLNSNNY